MPKKTSLDLGDMFKQQIQQIREEAFAKGRAEGRVEGIKEGRRLMREEALANVERAFASKTIPRNKPWSKVGKKGRSTTSQNPSLGPSRSSALDASSTTT